jgi:trehalose 6-phosphate phosphatase
VSEWPPPPAFERLPELADRLDDWDGLVLGLDFDGTLAPIVDDPAAASLTPATRMVLEELASVPTVALAVISGRGRSDLTERVGVDGAVFAGNHGLELGYRDRATVHPEAARRRATVRRLCETVDAQLQTAGVAGYEIEDKGVTATVHFRRVPDAAVPTVLSTVERCAADVDGVRVTVGKRIRELRPAVDWDKGAAMRLLREAAPDRWGGMYVGDDTTDEDGFRAVGADGVGVLVGADDEGPRTETAATHRLAGQESVASFLAWLGVSLDCRTLFDGRPDPWERFLGDADPPDRAALRYPERPPR